MVGEAINKPDMKPGTKPDEPMNEVPPQVVAKDRSRSRHRGVKDTTRRRGRPPRDRTLSEPKPEEPKLRNKDKSIF